MTREEAIEILTKMKPAPRRGDGKSLTHLLMSQALGLAIKALEQEPSGDLISRQAVKAYKYHRTVYPNFEDYVDILPSVDTQKSGKWRAVYQGDEIINYRCSECEFGNTFGKSTYRMNYCPNCGAKMIEQKESEILDEQIQALKEFANNLEQVEKEYAESQESEEV